MGLVQGLTLTFLVYSQEQGTHSAGSSLPLPIDHGILQVESPCETV